MSKNSASKSFNAARPLLYCANELYISLNMTHSCHYSLLSDRPWKSVHLHPEQSFCNAQTLHSEVLGSNPFRALSIE